uniref:Uncharacterized protein n=1 Tax=Nelumbo nucifera TaxID=4432 RepID=A0A822ZWJ8_NELNU|nr:TPA_asm: hypothetical protein HUJ06_018787 [Nelumbo nucifera]
MAYTLQICASDADNRGTPVLVAAGIAVNPTSGRQCTSTYHCRNCSESNIKKMVYASTYHYKNCSDSNVGKTVYAGTSSNVGTSALEEVPAYHIGKMVMDSLLKQFEFKPVKLEEPAFVPLLMAHMEEEFVTFPMFRQTFAIPWFCSTI